MKIVFTFMIAIVASICFAARTPEEKRAVTYGAQMKITLRVVDDAGATLTNAQVAGNLHLNDERGVPFNGKTDTNGLLEVKGS